MSMQIQAQLTLANVNVRREKAGKNGKGNIACDLKFNGDVGHKAVKGLFSSKTAYETALANLYDKKGQLVTSDVKTINLSHEAEHVVADLKTLGSNPIHLENGKLKSLVMWPKPGGIVELDITLQVYATKEQRGEIEEHLQEPIDLSASGRQVELHLEDEEEEEDDRQPALA